MVRCILIVLLLCCTAHGRLRESYQQCMRRYGHPVHKVDALGALATQHIKNGYRITCVFIPRDNNPVCERIIFERFERGVVLDMNDEVKQALIGASMDGPGWIQFGDQLWANRANTIAAEYDPTDNRLMISSRKYETHQQELNSRQIGDF